MAQRLNHWIRQSHRWLSIVFTLTVVANFAVRTQGEPPAWVTYAPLPPLFLMLFSGLYMFVLPYVGQRRVEAGAGHPHDLDGRR
jgi:cellulose synthase/poly-beta-1,6-N-acetylglucosamine synthase-like glycosyltransferase